MKHGQSENARLFCSTLGVNLFSLVSDASAWSSVTATITATGSNVASALATALGFTYSYPLSGFKVTVVNGPGGRFGGGAH
jgi:hypothetical protein